MTEANNRLAEISDELRRGEQPEPETVRTLLGWFDAKRRGFHVNGIIERALEEHSIRTQPDFRFAYIDSKINFVSAARGEGEALTGEEKPPATESGDGGAVVVVEPETPVVPPPMIVATVGGAIEDATYRIGRLPAANNPPARVKPNGTLREAVTLMLTHDCSQLPVLQSEREVKGMISWESIGARLATGNSGDTVASYMETHYELSAEVSLFDAINVIVEHDYVLICG